MVKYTHPSDNYLKALGSFLHTYAEIEYCMTGIFRVALGLTGNQAVSISSGWRVNTIMDQIKRYFQGIDKPLPKNLERAFPKLDELTYIRNKLLHFGNRADGDTVIVSDRYRTIRQRAKTWNYSTENLLSLEEDARTILSCLVVYWVDEKYSKTGKFDAWRPLSKRPWLYVPSDPISDHRPTTKLSRMSGSSV